MPAPAPPRHRFECPRGHVQLKIRHAHVYCFQCDLEGDDCRFQTIHDKAANRTLTHTEFAQQWGTHVWPEYL